MRKNDIDVNHAGTACWSNSAKLWRRKQNNLDPNNRVEVAIALETARFSKALTPATRGDTAKPSGLRLTEESVLGFP
ncbi:MAG: hypothetical protein O3C09_04905, partial [Proteobacteria bacterium]|nr:hypothetical protein [Pseudomonadota bacterium]